MWIVFTVICILLLFIVVRFLKRINNYTLIARNVTLIYYSLKNEHATRFKNEEQLLAATGIIDAWVYLNRKELRIGDIVDAVTFSKYDGIVLLPAQIDLYDSIESLTPRESDRLLNFVLNLEARLFSVDSPRISARDILYALKKKRDTIQKAIQATKQRAETSIPPAVTSLVNGIIESIDFAEVDTELAQYKEE